MILDAISTHHRGISDLLMVATDGVYFRTPHHSLPVSSALGDWDQGTKINLCLFKPGVYWDDSVRQAIRNNETPEFKSRGVPAAAFSRAISEIDDAFQVLCDSREIPLSPDTLDYIRSKGNGPKWPTVVFPLAFSMVTATQALARGKWETAGAINENVLVKQSSDPSTKRCNPYWDGDILRTQPRWMPNPVSMPYEKRFGIDDPFSDEAKQQWGETPDGLPGDIIREALR